MRILHVTNFNLKKAGNVFYDVPRKLNNGFIRNGHAVFEFSDRDIARTATIFGSRKFGHLPCNNHLIEICTNFRPELIVLGHADMIWPVTLRRIREMLVDVKIIQWNVDALFNVDNIDRMMSKAEEIDATFVTTAGDVLQQFAVGRNIVSYMPNPVDASLEIHRNFARDDLENDLVYCVGSSAAGRVYDGINADVNEMGRRLIEALPQVKFDFRGMLAQPGAWGAVFQDVMGNARMGLNLNRQKGDYLYASDRMAQIMGNGLLTLTDDEAGFEDIYRADELVFYGDFADLIEKIRFFKEHDGERRRIAEAGWRKAHGEYSETIVTQYMIEVAFGLEKSRDYAWPTKIYREVQDK